MKLLVVDDAEEVIEAVTVSVALMWQGTEVIGAHNGDEGLDLIEREHPDIVLLDIAMPGKDGFATLRDIRAFSDVPIIMLTATDEVLTKVKALELGADDYVAKPFNHLELLARVQAVLRRLDMPQASHRTPSFEGGELTIDFSTHEARMHGDLIALTATEYKVLYHLVRNADRVVPYETLLTRIWGREYVDEMDYLRVYIRRLRRKLEDDPRQPRRIVTERGIGYIYRVDA